MKILHLTIILISVAFNTNAQTPNYFDNDPSWYLGASHFGAGDGSDSYTESAVITLHLDADYDGYYTAYKRYNRYYTDLGTTEVAGYAARFVRQEGRAIYFYNEDTEADELFISYDLEVGDTVEGEFRNINGIVIVQSIDSVLVGADYRHIFYTSPDPMDVNNHLIEGIGYLHNTEQTIGDFFGGDYYAGEGIGTELNLNCYGENLTPLWSSTEDAECNLSLNINEEHKKQSSVRVFPNPFKDQISVSAETIIKTITISSIQGALVFENNVNNNNTIVNMSNMRPGTYILTMTFEDGTVERKKMMKQ